MNFPSVDYTWFGNGTVIALIAIIHVIISHGVAIGTSVLVVSTEYRAMKRKNEALDQVAKTMLKWVLIITTTMGAMTGVGIWFSVTTVIQPDFNFFFTTHFLLGMGCGMGTHLFLK
ncbi:hypothetical protein LSPH24S_03475 [Lysinibacillus sphaericus]